MELIALIELTTNWQVWECYLKIEVTSYFRGSCVRAKKEHWEINN